MNRSRKYIAFDIGASNGRCIIGNFDGQKLSLNVLKQFDNFYVRASDHYYWNILGLFDNVKSSLREAGDNHKNDLVSIGVDTWGVDFALLDKKGNLIGNPFCYRDPPNRRDDGTGIQESISAGNLRNYRTAIHEDKHPFPASGDDRLGFSCNKNRRNLSYDP